MYKVTLHIYSFKCAKLRTTVNDRPNKGREEPTIESYWTLLFPYILRGAYHLILRVHVLSLSLHLRLDGIEGMSNDNASATIEESTQCSQCEFLVPVSSLMVVSHLVSLISFVFV